MALRIVAEFVLAVLTFLAGNTLWQLLKREKFMQKAIGNEGFLRSFISHDILANPPSRLAPYFSKSDIGYFINIDVLIKADRNSLRRVGVIASMLQVMVLLASIYLGYVYLAANIGLLCLLGFEPVTDSAKSNAREHILTRAVILHKWHVESPMECDKWMTQVRGLRKLYSAVLATIEGPDASVPSASPGRAS